MYQVKGTFKNRLLVIWCLGVQIEEAFFSPMIRSVSFSKPISLDYYLHKSCLVFFFLPTYVGSGLLEWAGVGYFPS